MKRKLYLIQPTYRAQAGDLFQGKFMTLHSCAVPALAATIPPEWELEICLEYFENVNYDTDAPIVAISSMGYDMFHGREIADAFRRKGKTVIFGGYQANLCPDELKDEADSIVFGYPGPKAMAGILDDAQTGCLEPEYHVGVDINFPFDYSILLRRRITFMPILSSIGCRNNCDFCCTAARHKGEYRLRNIKHVIADLQAIGKRARRFFMVDCNIYNNRAYLITLCNEISRLGPSFQWGAEGTVDIGEDDEALRALRRAGCRLLYVGFETPNQRSLNGVHKPSDAATYASAIERIQKHGIAVAGFFMVGLDGDTSDTFDELFEFIHSARINMPIINILMPAPGTALYQRFEQEGRLLVDTAEGYLQNALFYSSSCSRCFFRPAGMTVDELEQGLIDLRLRLSSLRETVRRSLFPSPLITAILLVGNAQFRRDSLRFATDWKQRQNVNADSRFEESSAA